MASSSLFHMFLCASVLLLLSFESTCAFQPPVRGAPRTSSHHHYSIKLLRMHRLCPPLLPQIMIRLLLQTYIPSRRYFTISWHPQTVVDPLLPHNKTTLNTHVQQLESLCTLEAPANSPLVDGSWIVDYTTAPPPSNGQLGPFVGIARQVVSLQDGTYRNLLSVPPHDWLTASLDATWQEWDGVYLDNNKDSLRQSTCTHPISVVRVGKSRFKV